MSILSNNSETASIKLKKILEELNDSDTPLNIFYEQLEKEFGNKCNFSKYKINLENFYPRQNKLDLFYLLNDLHLEETGLVNLTNLFSKYKTILNFIT